MKKYFLISILFFSGCFDYQSPFEEEKSSLIMTQHKLYGIYIEDIIGMPEEQSNKLKKIITKTFMDNNIIASFKNINKNSLILKGTLVNYKQKRETIFLWKLIKEKPENLSRYKNNIVFTNQNTNDYLNNIARDITNQIISDLTYTKEKKNLIIRNTNLYENNKKNISSFLDSLKLQINSNNINIELYTPDDLKLIKYDDRILDINISKMIEEDKERIVVLWTISDYKGNKIGNIKQSKLLEKGLSKKLWKQINEKIIEMALPELNYLTWVDY